MHTYIGTAEAVRTSHLHKMVSKKLVLSVVALVLGTFAVSACNGNGEDEGNNADPNNGEQPATGNGGTNNAGAPMVRAPVVKPIKAVFTQENFTTEYTVEIENPDGDEIAIAWNGPNCGAWNPENKITTDAKTTSKLTWMHQSPPCPAHTHHDEVTINLFAMGKRSGRTVQCIYRGAASGEGPTCFQQGFSGSWFGHPQNNSAHIRYRAPNKQCSQVELIQVMSVWKKGDPDRLAIPHNSGMDESLPGLEGYQIPDVADDAGGYVVDKFYYSDIMTNDPYYSGAEKGSQTQDAELDDRPGNTREGYKAVFEVCAFCSGNPTDAEYGNYLDCITWEHDGDSGEAKKTEPQPANGPSQGFRDAVAKWNTNKKFTMPAK